MGGRIFFGDPHGEILFFGSKGRIFGLRRRKTRGFFFEEQRDPHEEGSHLNASKAIFFVNTGVKYAIQVRSLIPTF